MLFGLFFDETFKWNQTKKHATAAIAHVCFVALFLVGSIGSYLNSLNPSSNANHFLETRYMLKRSKNDAIFSYDEKKTNKQKNRRLANTAAQIGY